MPARYEYDYTSGSWPEDLVAELNGLAADGWEVVSIVSVETGGLKQASLVKGEDVGKVVDSSPPYRFVAFIRRLAA